MWSNDVILNSSGHPAEVTTASSKLIPDDADCDGSNDGYHDDNEEGDEKVVDWTEDDVSFDDFC